MVYVDRILFHNAGNNKVLRVQDDFMTACNTRFNFPLNLLLANICGCNLDAWC